MVKEKRYLSGSSIIIVLIAVLITAKIVRSYEISLLPSTLITITIAVILWYGFNFFIKKIK